MSEQQKSLKEIIKEEYIRCKASPIYFMKKYCMIQHPVKGRIPFHLYPYQEQALQNFVDNDRNIILKSRQLGISTLIAGYTLWLILFHEDKNVLVVAIDQATSKNLVTKIRVMIEYLPSWLKPKTQEDNKLSVRLTNGSQVKAVASTGTSGRSEALSLLIIDEAAFVGNAEELWASSQQTLGTGGRAILLSTPNGTGNFFHKMWMKSEAGENRFKAAKLPWYVHPERDQEWRDRQDAELGPRLAAQECMLGDTEVTIRNKQTGLVETISIFELERRLQNINYEVLTPTGFEAFKGLKKVSRSEWYTISFDDGNKLSCTPEHRVYSNGVEYYACDLNKGMSLDGKDGKKKIVNIDKKATQDCFYDLVEVNSHIYYANNIIVHNCDCDFSTSGNTVVHPDLLTWYQQTHCQEPMYKRGFDGNLWVWEEPDYTKNYIVTADVARGDSSDFSGFHVIEVEDCRQVAEYKGQLTTKDYGNLLVAVATEYNDALLVIENANIGWASLQVAIDRDYKNLYYTYKDSVFDPDSYLHKQYDLASKKDAVAGFSMTSKIRPLAVSKLDLYMREKGCIIRSRRLIDELLVFVWKNGRAEAQHGYNDDLVMSWMQGLWVRDTAMKLRQSGIELNKLALSHINSSKHLSGFTTTGKFNNNPYKMDDGKGTQEDLNWLL